MSSSEYSSDRSYSRDESGSGSGTTDSMVDQRGPPQLEPEPSVSYWMAKARGTAGGGGRDVRSSRRAGRGKQRRRGKKGGAVSSVVRPPPIDGALRRRNPAEMQQYSPGHRAYLRDKRASGYKKRDRRMMRESTSDLYERLVGEALAGDANAFFGGAPVVGGGDSGGAGYDDYEEWEGAVSLQNFWIAGTPPEQFDHERARKAMRVATKKKRKKKKKKKKKRKKSGATEPGATGDDSRPSTGAESMNADDATEIVTKQIRRFMDENYARCLHIFTKMDTDDSGTLGRKEFTTACKRLGLSMSRRTLGNVFDKLDKDGGGSISYKELFKATRAAAVSGVQDVNARLAAHQSNAGLWHNQRAAERGRALGGGKAAHDELMGRQMRIGGGINDEFNTCHKSTLVKGSYNGPSPLKYLHARAPVYDDVSPTVNTGQFVTNTSGRPATVGLVYQRWLRSLSPNQDRRRESLGLGKKGGEGAKGAGGGDGKDGGKGGKGGDAGHPDDDEVLARCQSPARKRRQRKVHHKLSNIESSRSQIMHDVLELKSRIDRLEIHKSEVKNLIEDQLRDTGEHNVKQPRAAADCLSPLPLTGAYQAAQANDRMIERSVATLLERVNYANKSYNNLVQQRAALKERVNLLRSDAVKYKSMVAGFEVEMDKLRDEVVDLEEDREEEEQVRYEIAVRMQEINGVHSKARAAFTKEWEQHDEDDNAEAEARTKMQKEVAGMADKKEVLKKFDRKRAIRGSLSAAEEAQLKQELNDQRSKSRNRVRSRANEKAEMKRAVDEWKRITDTTGVHTPEQLTEEIVANEERSFEKFQALERLEAEKGEVVKAINDTQKEITDFDEKQRQEQFKRTLVKSLKSQLTRTERCLERDTVIHDEARDATDSMYLYMKSLYATIGCAKLAALHLLEIDLELPGHLLAHADEAKNVLESLPSFSDRMNGLGGRGGRPRSDTGSKDPAVPRGVAGPRYVSALDWTAEESLRGEEVNMGNAIARMGVIEQRALEILMLSSFVASQVLSRTLEHMNTMAFGQSQYAGMGSSALLGRPATPVAAESETASRADGSTADDAAAEASAAAEDAASASGGGDGAKKDAVAVPPLSLADELAGGDAASSTRTPLISTSRSVMNRGSISRGRRRRAKIPADLVKKVLSVFSTAFHRHGPRHAKKRSTGVQLNPRIIPKCPTPPKQGNKKKKKKKQRSPNSANWARDLERAMEKGGKEAMDRMMAGEELEDEHDAAEKVLAAKEAAAGGLHFLKRDEILKAVKEANIAVQLTAEAAAAAEPKEKPSGRRPRRASVKRWGKLRRSVVRRPSVSGTPVPTINESLQPPDSGMGSRSRHGSVVPGNVEEPAAAIYKADRGGVDPQRLRRRRSSAPQLDQASMMSAAAARDAVYHV